MSSAIRTASVKEVRTEEPLLILANMLSSRSWPRAATCSSTHNSHLSEISVHGFRGEGPADWNKWFTPAAVPIPHWMAIAPASAPSRCAMRRDRSYIPGRISRAFPSILSVISDEVKNLSQCGHTLRLARVTHFSPKSRSQICPTAFCHFHSFRVHHPSSGIRPPPQFLARRNVCLCRQTNFRHPCHFQYMPRIFNPIGALRGQSTAVIDCSPTRGARPRAAEFQNRFSQSAHE